MRRRKEKYNAEQFEFQFERKDEQLPYELPPVRPAYRWRITFYPLSEPSTTLYKHMDLFTNADRTIAECMYEFDCRYPKFKSMNATLISRPK